MTVWRVLAFFLLTFEYAAGQKALSELQLDSVQFSEADLPLVMDFLGLKAKEMNGQPSNFVLYDPEGSLAKEDPRITLSLTNVPFSVVFKYITRLSRTGFLIDKRVVWIGKTEDLQVLQKRRSSRTSKILASPAFRKLARIRVPEIDFTETSLSEAIEGLRQLDRANGGPGNFVSIPGETIVPADVKIDMKVAGINLAELVQFTSELSGFQLRVDGRAIVLRAPDARPVRAPQATSNRIYQYLGSRIVEQVSLVETTIPEMMDYIQFHSKSLTVPDGINMVKLTSSQKTVTLDLKGARLIDILRYMNEQTNTTFRIDRNAVQILDLPPVKK